MSLLQALVLGAVQGLTEFLPVSSSGHLVIFPKVLGWKEHSLVFDTTLHLATALALIFYFRKDILDIIRSFLKDILKRGFSFKKYSSEGLMGWKIIIGTIPVGIFGLLFADTLESVFRDVSFVSLFLLVGSALMFLGEKKLNKRLLVKDEISISKSFKVGLFQVLSLLPGISRSGSTIAGGMFFGLSRKEAAKFSFLLSIPAVLAAGISQLISVFDYLNMADFAPMLVGFLSSFIVGLLAIGFLLKYVRKNNLYPFIIYRVGLTLFLLIVTLIK
jgi:undecaprenyl-diphosphatase